MELSPEDALRLNVLLANEQHAIRINESSMTVYATSARGESSVKLNPTCRDEQYLKCVRELFSGHVMGSPGGYPVFLQRWTRMGQQREENLDQLLLLGEPEAVVAVVGAEGLTDELARRAWWAMEDAENGRCMLERECVVNGKMGPLLAQYLVEHLPFEEEAINMIRSIRLALQPGLLSDERFVDQYIAMRKRKGYGPVRICKELRERGINDTLIHEWIDERDDEWRTNMKQVVEKKFSVLVNAEYKEQARLARFLEYRGFPNHMIRDYLFHD